MTANTCFLMAIASALHGFGGIDPGPTGWSWIGTITIVGGIALTWVPPAASHETE